MRPLEVEGLGKRYGRVEALHDVGFAVEAGEVFGYLGANGAGKSTTLRILAGLVHADRGAVRVLGAPPGRAATREDVGYLPGEVRPWAELTGRATLDHFARLRPSRPPVLRERLVETLALAESELARPLKQLSHGTRQKVGLVAAMQHDPALLLLDEPTNGLDPLVQHAFRALLLERARAGRAILLSSHVLPEVEAVCARVAVLQRGRLLVVETIEALRARAVRRATVTFRGDPPAGLAALPGVRRVAVDGRDVTAWLEGDLDPFLRAVAAAGVERFTLPEAELEDIVLRLYEEGARAHA